MEYLSNLKNTFPRRFEARRKELGLNFETLAEKTGISASTLYRYETGLNEPSMSGFIAIADALETSPYWLIGYQKGSEIEGLNDTERELIAVFREKRLERQSALVEALKLLE